MHSKSTFSLVAVTLVTFLQVSPLYSGEHLPKVCFSQRCVDVEIAQTFAERVRGLQGRPSMDKNNGMLFVFEEPARHGFWMKDTLIPLDMIWMDAQGRIVTVFSGVPPCAADPCASYFPEKEALYVLEVNAGVAGEWGLKVGDQAEFK